MIKFKDASGDEFVAHRNGDRVTVMRGCSVVMDAFVFDDNLNVIKSHDSAPSVLAVRIALGLVTPSAKPVPVEAPAVAPPAKPVPRKHKPLTVPIGDGKE